MAAAAVKRLALVTGANQGIGKEIAVRGSCVCIALVGPCGRVLRINVRGSSLHAHDTFTFLQRGLGKIPGMHVIATARDVAKGEEMAKELRESGADVSTFPLEITSDESVAALKAHLESLLKDGGALDVLVNNAGFAHKGDTFGHEEAQHVIAVNFFGTARVTEAVLPFLKRSGDARIVNVCSQAGRLAQVSPPLQARFQDPEATKEGLAKLAQEFCDGVRDGSYAEKGWPKSMYGVSKLLEIAYTFVLTRDLLPFGIAVNAVCPGWCNTSMSSHRGERSPAKGAETPIFLATRPGKTVDITGGFWYDMELISW